MNRRKRLHLKTLPNKNPTTDLQELRKKIELIQNEYLDALHGTGNPLTLKRGQELLLELRNVFVDLQTSSTETCQQQREVHEIHQVAEKVEFHLKLLLQQVQHQQEEIESDGESEGPFKHQVESKDTNQVETLVGHFKRVAFCFNKQQSTANGQVLKEVSPSILKKEACVTPSSIFDLKYRRVPSMKEYIPVPESIHSSTFTYPTEWMDDFNF